MYHTAKSLLNVYKLELLQPVIKRHLDLLCDYFPVEAKTQTNSKYLSILCLLKAFNTHVAITGCTSSPLAWKSSCLLLDYFGGWGLFVLFFKCHFPFLPSYSRGHIKELFSRRGKRELFCLSFWILFLEIEQIFCCIPFPGESIV